MLRAMFISLVAALSLWATVSRAQDDAAALFDAMGLPEIIAVMGQEGTAYGEMIARDLFPSGMNPRWAATVAEVYASDRMADEMRSAFVATLEGKNVGPMLDFYQTDLGQQIVMLEISAREAMLDPALEQASKDMAAEALQNDTTRAQLITDFIKANDLIEANVVGGLNSNYGFITGLLSGGASIPGVMSDEVLADVWAQEPEIRASTTEWLYAFLMLAYEPLSDAKLQELTAFTQTAPGRELTAALFASFDQTFERVSRELGVAASGFIISQEL